MSSSSPKPKWSARMGSVMRRTSSVLTISRPGSVTSDRDTDNSSLTGSTRSRKASIVNSPPLPSVVTPSPIAESPLREAAAEAQEPIRPSPLAQPITSSEVIPPTLPPPVEETQSPTGYIPPPVIDSTVGNPGAFIDVTDELPKTDIAQDPQAVVQDPQAVTQDPQEVTQDPQAVAPVEPHVEPVTLNAPEPAEPEAITEALVDEPTSYFVGPMAESIKDIEPVDHADNTTEFSEAVHGNAYDISPEPHHEQSGEAAEYYRGDVTPTTREVVLENANIVLPEPNLGQREEPEAHHHDDAVPVATEREIQEEPQQKSEPIAIPVATEREIQEEFQQKTEPITIPVPVPVPNYDMPSYPMNLGSEREVWGGEHDQGAYPSSVPVVNTSSEDVRRDEESPAPSIRMSFTDPFADPIAPRITVSQPVLDMPQPEFADNYHQGPTETHSHGPIVMPQPSFVDVAASRHIHHASSKSSLKNGNTGNLIETDETLPLLSRPGTPSKHKPASYLQASAHPQRNLVSISPLVYSASQSTNSNGNANSWHPHPGAHPRLHTLGWLEYHLPDGTVYYVHPTSRVTTEINLRSERMLTGVERFLADYGKDQSGSAMEGTLTSGGEIWLRDVGTAKRGLVLERWWVDHRSRTVVMSGDEHEHARKGSGKGKAKKGGAVFTEEDQLDTEYRYWSFMEAHPAHNSLPAKAKIEAMDVLTWAWTERLLPSHRAVPAPFTQEECQELMTLIRSFGDDHDDHGIQTRIVSRVLLRVAHWRQSYFRPNKPLPTNVGSNQSPFPIVPRRPFKWVIVDFVVSCLFLGIPYIFFERTRLSSRIDEESGLRYATPTLVIGACTCLVAAIVLSASVTFLSLPGLDAFSRTTGMVAILFAAFSMAATVVAIFRHKADLERPISHIGVEGMMVISRRTVILSLPLVLLVYSIIAFITGIVLYSFRGVTLFDPLMTRKSFEDYTRWGVVSVVGALAGMVMTSMLLFRR